MTSVLLESYSKALVEFDDEEVLATLDKLVRSERAEFEPKIPEMGTLLAMVRRRRDARKAVARQAAEDAAWEAHKARCRKEWEEDGLTPSEGMLELQKRLDELTALKETRDAERRERIRRGKMPASFETAEAVGPPCDTWTPEEVELMNAAKQSKHEYVPIGPL